ncbi:MAG: MFS transporter [Planctomycetia bacterium]|nr:MFS transporter [Planctomycetia bacterium]
MSGSPRPIRIPGRRRALELGHVNGTLWAVGNGLTTGPLVSYLGQDLHATGFALGLLFAAPTLAGLLRLVAPVVIHRAGTAKRACLSLFLTSYLLILGLPAIAAPGPGVNPRVALYALVGLLFFHQFLEYLATVALWSWWADLVPQAIRGRYFARRQVWQLGFSIPMLLASGYFADYWRTQYADDPDRLLLAYAMPTALGAVLLLASILPLALMPTTRQFARPQMQLMWSMIAAPFADRRFWRLLIFRAWFSLSNGISQVVQGVYPKQVLGFGVGELSVMKTVTQCGQFGASGSVGRFSDRYGNRPALVLAQACVSLGLVFFIAASDSSTKWLLVGAWVLFAAYVAHNICLPNLILKLAPGVEKSSYVASYEALGSVCNAGATILGGLAFDWLKASSPDQAAEPYRSCLIVLCLGLAMRGFGVVLLAAIREPGAWTWREIISGSRGQRDALDRGATAPTQNPLPSRERAG